MRMASRIARLEQQRPAIPARVRAWLGWPVTEEELAQTAGPVIDPATLRPELREWLGL